MIELVQQVLDSYVPCPFQPVYGVIQAKLELITHAYFEGRDFSQVTLLEDTYKTLNMSLNESLLNDSQVFVGWCRNSCFYTVSQKMEHQTHSGNSVKS